MHKIKKKCIKKTKIPNKKTLEDITLEAADLSNHINTAHEKYLRIVYLDECLVTTKTIPTHVWSLPKSNAQIDLSWIKSPCKAIIIAASREYGLE